jgi:RecA/RadA recombinase
MPSPDPFKVTAPAAPIDASGPIDWIATKTAILARLDIVAEYAALGVRFAGSQGKEWCECHAIDRADETPSAAINIKSGLYKDLGGDGAVTGFFDFALKHGPHGRWIDDIKFYAAKVGLELGKVTSHSGGRVREATYEYQDEAGEVRYAVFRYRTPNGKKSFSQHPPDGKGGWRFGADCMKGVEPLPYRLPELLASAAADDPIFVVEGEKDVERLRSHALTATTNHQGASSTDATWPKFVRFFAGRDVFILPDNDPGGKIHARKVAAYLHGTARTLRVVELPGLPPKGDVSDWLDLGHTLDELDKFISGTKLWDPADEGLVKLDEGAKPAVASDPERTHAVLVRMSDVAAKPVEWLIPDKVPIGKITLFAGQPGIGKSYLTMDLIARVTTGGEIPGPSNGECIPSGSVILLSAEDGLADTIRPRLDMAGADCSRVHALTTLRTPDGNNEPFSLEYLPLLEDAVSQVGDVKLIIIDPITSYVGGRIDDHKNAQLRVMLQPLAAMAEECNIAIITVTHLNKGASANAINRVTGSLAYIALARAAWLITRDPEDRLRRLFLSIKNNLAPDPTGLAYRVIKDQGIEWEQTVIGETADEVLGKHAKADRGDREEKIPTKGKQAVEWLAERLPPGTEENSEIIKAEAKAAGFGHNTLWDAKKKLDLRARKGDDSHWIWINPLGPPVKNADQTPNSKQLNGAPF